MSQRLQARLDEMELQEIRQIARQKQLTVGEWVRQALRTARQRDRDAATKLKTARHAARHTTDLAVLEGNGGRLDPVGLELLAKRLANASQRGLDGEPEVREGRWHKHFSGMTVCGEGDLVKMFLLPGQPVTGKRVS